MSEKHEKHKKSTSVVANVKNLLLSVENRNNAIMNCCPSLIENPQDETSRLRKLSEAQREVDDSLKQLREATEDRLSNYSNPEVIFLAHAWAAVWSSENSLRLDSNDMDKLVGRNNEDELESLIRSLLDGSSLLFNFISLTWANRGGNCYSINLTNPNRLHKLILGDIQIA